ncbi:MAG: O-antigen ligase family protein [candidate division WOR-3 bacterium]|jgi:O-antigen ligase|nr:O-antigen ligase family protein [candidate division WOR-3 bacterium]MCR4423979.1 O-antigen ligase family protein [candidate division WOR-3 bacterium]MDH7519602.1 O-antigen ligase family protein [bacterium]
MNIITLLTLGFFCLALLLRYPEITLILFLFSGTFKSQFAALFPQAPDITVILALILITGTAFSVPAFLRTARAAKASTATSLKFSFDSSQIFNFLLTFFSLVVVMTLSAFADPDNSYGLEKTVRFATLTGLALFAPIVTVHSEKNLLRLLITFIIVALLMVALGQTTPEGLTAFGANHIATGRIIGLGFLGGLYFTLRSQPRTLTTVVVRVVMLIVNIVLGYGVFYSGSRGVLVALLCALGTAGLIAFYFRKGRNLILTGAATVIAIIVITSIFAPDAALTMNKRIRNTVSGPIDQTAHTRVIRAEAAIDMFRNHPFTGVGIGGFDQEFNPYQSERGDYPHNLFLEVAAELGIVGLLLITLLLFIPLRALFRGLAHGNRPITLLILTITVYLLVNALFSGDLNDNRFLFAALGLCLAAPRAATKASEITREGAAQWQPASAS